MACAGSWASPRRPRPCSSFPSTPPGNGSARSNLVGRTSRRPLGRVLQTVRRRLARQWRTIPATRLQPAQCHGKRKPDISGKRKSDSFGVSWCPRARCWDFGFGEAADSPPFVKLLLRVRCPRWRSRRAGAGRAVYRHAPHYADIGMMRPRGRSEVLPWTGDRGCSPALTAAACARRRCIR